MSSFFCLFKRSILAKHYLSYFIKPNSCISPVNCFGKYLPDQKNRPCLGGRTAVSVT